MAFDQHGRTIDYLRISVTDRCNLRCLYCMPEEGVSWKPHDAMLSLEEITRFVRIAAEEGFRRIRLTGGEPLQKLFTVSVERKLCLLQITPATKLELAVDCGQITSPFSTEVCPINETELEIKSGTKEDLLAYVDEIAKLVPVSGEERSKYERGMKLCGVNLK